MKIVIDDGSNYIKIAYKDGLELVNKLIPSRVLPRALSATDSEGFGKESFKIGDNHYSVSKFAANTIPTNSPDYQLSDHNRVLIQHALKSITDKKSVSVAVTIPISDYYTDTGEINNEMLKKKSAHVKASVTPLDGSEQISISDCYVLPEGVPAFVYAHSELNIEGDVFMIVDVGGTTTDIALLNSDNQIVDSASLSVGALSFLNKFSTTVRSKLRLMDELSDDQAMKGLITGKVLNQDVSDIQKAIKHEFQSTIESVIKKRFKGAGMCDAIVLSGGGAMILELNYPNVFKTKNPQLDNANGILMMLGWDDE